MNPQKGDVPFEAGGRKYTLCYSHRALVLLEEQLDKGLVKIIKEVDGWRTNPDDIRLGTVCSMLWAGLQKHQPDMTIDDATAILDDLDGGVATAIDLLGEGFQKAFNASGTKGTNPPKRAENGTGMSSSSSMPVSDIGQMTSGTLRQEN